MPPAPSAPCAPGRQSGTSIQRGSASSVHRLADIWRRTLLTHFDIGKPDDVDPIERQSSRPTLGVLCYPVISMVEPNVHQGSRNNLLGNDPLPALAESLSAEKQVTTDTPPCFIWSTQADRTVRVENSLEFAAALQRHGVPLELHIYPKGGHGIGLGGNDAQGGTDLHPWTRECIRWLQEQHFAR